MFDLRQIQEAIVQDGEEAWLFYNFRGLDPCADSILKIPKDAVMTRRWFYLIPAHGTPMKLVHKIESRSLDHLPGGKMEYAGWRDLHENLKKMLSGLRSVCMQYSPANAIPYVSYVDAGTVELVKSVGVEIRSSADLVQYFEARWSEENLSSHLKAVRKVNQILQKAFGYVRQQIEQKGAVSEYNVQQFIIKNFEEMDMTFSHPPIVAVNEHSGDPHYEPKMDSLAIRKGDFLLIDLWAREKEPEGIYADITWVAMVAETVPPQYAAVFSVVKKARDAAVEFIARRLESGKQIRGYEVDDECRKIVAVAGYGQYFIHRTGHSIGKEVHGKGVNMDNFETRDERKLLEGTGFSIEPGIYLPHFGIRSEINVYLHKGHAHVSTLPKQEEVLPLFAANFL